MPDSESLSQKLNDLNFELETVRERFEEKVGNLEIKIFRLEKLQMCKPALLDQGQIWELVAVLFAVFSLKNRPEAFLAGFSTFLAIKML